MMEQVAGYIDDELKARMQRIKKMRRLSESWQIEACLRAHLAQLETELGLGPIQVGPTRTEQPAGA